MKSQKKRLVALAKGMMIFIIPFLFLSFLRTSQTRSLEEAEEYFLNEQAGISDETWTQIETLQSSPQVSIEQLLSLSGLYFQSVRENADTNTFANIDSILEILDTYQADDVFQDALRAQILLAKHRFQDAKEISERIVRNHPLNPGYKGILFDCLIELGDYENAESVLQEMIELKPDANTFTRTAYLREIYGDFEGAVEMMENAVFSGSAYGENQAWNFSELGRLWLDKDDEKSFISYKNSNTTLPDYTFAQVGLAKHALKNEDKTKALEILETALSLQPLPEIAALIGDIHLENEEKEKSEIYYRIVEIGYQSIRESGTDTDLELSQFLLERNRKKEMGLELAIKAYEKRANIYTAANLALGYHLNNEPEQAKKHIDEALRTSSKDAKILKYYEMISAG